MEDQIIVGSAASVLDQLVAFRDQTGHFGTLLATGHDWDRAELWKRSMTLLGEDGNAEIPPALRGDARRGLSRPRPF